MEELPLYILVRIFAQLDIRDQVAFERTSLKAYAATKVAQAYLLDFGSLLSTFFPNDNHWEIRNLQRTTGMIMAGPAVNARFAGASSDSSNAVLELYVSNTFFDTVEAALINTGYYRTRCSRNEKAWNLEGLPSTTTLFLDFDATRKNITLQTSSYTLGKLSVRLRGCRGASFERLLLSAGSKDMNFVTHSHVYCLYPKATIKMRINISRRGFAPHGTADVTGVVRDNVDGSYDYRNKDRFPGDRFSWVTPITCYSEPTGPQSLYARQRTETIRAHSWRLEYDVESTDDAGFMLRYATLRHENWDEDICVSEKIASALQRELLTWTIHHFLEFVERSCSDP